MMLVGLMIFSGLSQATDPVHSLTRVIEGCLNQSGGLGLWCQGAQEILGRSR